MKINSFDIKSYGWQELAILSAEYLGSNQSDVINSTRSEWLAQGATGIDPPTSRRHRRFPRRTLTGRYLCGDG